MLRIQLRLCTATLSLLLPIGFSGCKAAPTPADFSTPVQSPNTSLSPHGVANAQPGNFDFYVFNLSWSPQFCEIHADSPECAARPGFVVHGLWPQNNNGTYPENCNNPTQPSNASAYIDLIPTMALIQHEWTMHGTCSGLGPDEYFSQVRRALQSFEIPATFAASNIPPAKVAPGVILAQFSKDNPAFPRSSFALVCTDNSLTAIEVCFNKTLNPIPCQGIRSCRAKIIKIASP